MTKIDLKKNLKHLYNPSAKEFSMVEVPPMNFLMIDGHGDPNNNPIYQQVMESLYAVAYSLKFALKHEGMDYAVMPLEGLWWMENMAEFSMKVKDRWDWTMMILQPDMVTAEHVEKVRDQVAKKKDLPMLAKMRFETYTEGPAAQILYFGAYADEGPTIVRLHEFIHAQGYELSGKHHEIYLGDPRRNSPDKLKTVIRQPMHKGS